MKITLKDTQTTKISYLATGDTFLYDSVPYMRVGHNDGSLKIIADSMGITTFGIWAVNLTNGKLRKFDGNTIISYTNFELKEI